MMKQELEPQQKGLTGIANLGNTCFLNTCLQVLNHTYELHDFADSKKCQTVLIQKMKENNIDAILFYEWNSLRNMMWSNNGIVSPQRFVQCVQHIAHLKNKEIFTGWSQNDMCEFLLFIIDCMHTSMARSVTIKISGTVKTEADKMAAKSYELLSQIYSKEYSEIMDMFYAVYVTRLTSMKKEEVSLIPAHFFIMDLDATCASIYEGFDLFTRPEKMDGENEWFNETTKKKEPVMKECIFFTLPKILVICLKRFSPDGQRKLQNLVDFPIDGLDLSKYVKGYYSNRYIYDLFGVANHTGSVQGGHYTAYVKHGSDTWLHCNDTEISLLEKSKVRETVVSNAAYCLFYRKRE